MLGIYSLILIVIDSTRGLALAADTPKGGIGGIFKLPELVVHTNSSYLLRQFQTHLECRISGQPLGDWPNVTLERLLWMKDGTPVAELHNNDITVNEPAAGSEPATTPVLRIVHATHQSEGDYQCSAILRNIVVKPDQTVDSRLVSAPLKLRRARITKFERYESQPIVRVKQGQVARLACFGLPDVIPGPPEVSFEKHGHEGVLLGRTGNERFIATPSGLQIALTQPSDAGRYFCVVRNVFTNQTRRAPRPVVLVVEPTALSDYRASQSTYHGHRNFSRRAGHYFDNFDIPLTTTPPAPLPTPRIVYPEAVNYSEPIELHVVTGQTAILECVIWEAKIMWNNPSFTMPAVSLTDDRARIRQIWGNLRIKQVTAEDSGDYVCHGLAWPTTLLTAQDLTARLLESTHPRVTYRLIVHAPTSVRLMLAQQVQDKSWQLSCYAHNLRYEIPMVYVNGLPLIDAMEEMGVPPQTNFYTNPINVTLRANNPLSGSIQCISRPAMDEAEVYGFELERGRAMNLYVDDRLNKRIAPLPKKTTEKNLEVTPTEVQKSVQTVHTTETPLTKPQKIEEEDIDRKSKGVLGLMPEKDSKAPIEIIQKYFEILQPMAFVAGDQSVRIQWSIQPSDHPLLTRLLNFAVEMKRKEKGAIRKDEEFNEDEENVEENPDEWVVKDHVQPHVRALTVRRLVPNSEYQFRITANFNDRTNATSQPTSWLIIDAAAPMLPLAPQV
ncbi:neuRonal IGCAM [Ditylenchus destructor]|uniref:NeuRonal IGCAM n=1 Tax=Ditylenchus destructor TaxID=166010 RepID=A0AAD4R2N8_9BILA|nr:neuRonal IGCAM [Ditylenchus destructor]